MSSERMLDGAQPEHASTSEQNWRDAKPRCRPVKTTSPQSSRAGIDHRASDDDASGTAPSGNAPGPKSLDGQAVASFGLKLIMRRQLARGCTTANSGAVPMWLKLGYGSFLGVLIPVYWREYGGATFLWIQRYARPRLAGRPVTPSCGRLAVGGGRSSASLVRCSVSREGAEGASRLGVGSYILALAAH